MIDSLHENKQLGWHFLDSKKELVEGVKSGKYYAGIYLPADFSKDLVSFTSGTIVKPKIEYYSNQKSMLSHLRLLTKEQAVSKNRSQRTLLKLLVLH